MARISAKNIMQKYIGTKALVAVLMTLGDYNLHRGWNIPADEDPAKEGYLVQYEDGYVSWSPKEVFEESYITENGYSLSATSSKPHEQRVIVEAKELFEKAIKLREFIEENPFFNKLDPEEQKRMKLQLVTMKCYYSVLAERILRFDIVEQGIETKESLEDVLNRRNRLDLMTPAELAIHKAIEEVEKVGADVRLTNAIMQLQKAKENVSNFTDNLTGTEGIGTTKTPEVADKEIKESNTAIELTFGQKAVGASFNPSFMPEVDKVKMLFAETIDVMEDNHKKNCEEKSPNWERNVFRTEAYNAAVRASSAIVKYLTWRD